MDARRVENVGRLVQDEQRGGAEQGARQAEEERGKGLSCESVREIRGSESEDTLSSAAVVSGRG
jgi:hypothetical protein